MVSTDSSFVVWTETERTDKAGKVQVDDDGGGRFGYGFMALPWYKRLFEAQHGYYRAYALVVSPAHAASTQSVKLRKLLDAFEDRSGGTVDVADEAMDSNWKATLFVYRYERGEATAYDDSELMPSTDARADLAYSGLTDNFTRAFPTCTGGPI